jgi:CDGSH-type Zn-finger protein
MSKTKLIINNGSIKIEGDFEIMDSSYGVWSRGRTALGLCRCGLSASKPFFAMVHIEVLLNMNRKRLICAMKTK